MVSFSSLSGFLRCLTSTALAFYLFSYQVHEKSILLVALPVTMMAADSMEPALAYYLPLVATGSMYPLLEKDGHVLTYFAVSATFLLLASIRKMTSSLSPGASSRGGDEKNVRSTTRLRRIVDWMDQMLLHHDDMMRWTSIMGFAVLHVARVYLSPPANLPYLSDLAFVSFSFLHFAAIYAFITLKQLATYFGSTSRPHPKVKTI